MADYVYLDDEPIEKKPKERKRIQMTMWRKSLSALLAVAMAFGISIGSYYTREPGSTVHSGPAVYWGGGDDTGF